MVLADPGGRNDTLPMPEPRLRTHWPDHRRLIGWPRAASCGLALPLVAAAVVILACDGSPTDSGRTESPDDLTSLQIVAPPTLQVHEVALLSATAFNRGGQQVVPSSIAWRSIDPSLATITATGVITTSRRGTVRLTASVGQLTDTVTIRITAQLRVQPDMFYPLDGWPMAIGDQLQLTAGYVDVNGQPIPEVPSVVWLSTDPAAVSVGETGLVTAHRATLQDTITAATPGETDQLAIHVLDVLAGQPARVRIAHAIPGLGPIRFTLSPGGDLSLSFGESVELPVLSGTLRVTTDGLPRAGYVDYYVPQDFLGVVRPGDHLSIYTAGSTEVGVMQGVWPTTSGVASDSGLVRLIQSSPALVLSIRSDGARTSALPELCYFDPGDVSQYFARAAGDFEIIGQQKYEAGEIGRAQASVVGGHAVTMVVTGGGQQPFGILAFPDF